MPFATESVLPVDHLPLLRDPDLAHAVEMEMHGLSASDREKAQAAIRRVHGSGITGQFGELVSAYTTAVRAAIASD